MARLSALMDEHDALRTDRAQTELLYLRAESERETQPDSALRMFEQARRRARSGGHELLLARVLRALYSHHRLRVGASRVSVLIEEAVELFEKHGAYAEATGCLHTASRDAMERTAHDEARSMLADMERFAELSGDPLCIAECRDRESDLLREAGETMRALDANREALQTFEALGCLARAAGLINALAQIQWFNMDDLDAAADTLHDCIARHSAIGSVKLSYFPRYNLASIEFYRGRIEAARELVDWLDANTEALGYQIVRHMIHLMQAILAAHDDRWPVWDEHIAVALSTGALDEFLAEEDVALWRYATVARGARRGRQRRHPARRCPLGDRRVQAAPTAAGSRSGGASLRLEPGGLCNRRRDRVRRPRRGGGNRRSRS